MRGVVDAVREQIAPPEAASVQTLFVAVGQDVRAGDALVQMDTTILDAEMKIERLQAQRQFASAVARAENSLRDARLRQAEETGELEVLDAEIERLDELLARRLIDAQTITRLRARQQALTRSVELYPEMIGALERDLAQAKARATDVEGGFGWDGDMSEDGLPEGLDTDLEASRHRLGLLNLRRDRYTLRAGSDGTVARIYHAPGDVVQAGIPIMTVVDKGTRQVVGFLPEANVDDVAIGMTAYLTRAAGGADVIRAQVTAMAPEILGLPNRVRPFPGQTLRGMRVILEPEGGHDLIPGEGVTIHLHRPALAWLRDALSWKDLHASDEKE
jgi:multidrug resistance efflux pump